MIQLRISNNQRYLVDAGGKPFFWLGDTAWELFHRLNREEAILYLEDRKKKGFNVIMATLLPEVGIDNPNAYGYAPLINNNPETPNEAYFEHVDFIMNEAERLGMIIGLLPSWGDKWHKSWGIGPEIFTPENAASFGKFVARRYQKYSLVWIMGGDRDCITQLHFDIINAMAAAIKSEDKVGHLFSFHPQAFRSSSDFFKDADWIDFHMTQTAHIVNTPNYKYNLKHAAITPLKPHFDGEPRYEDHPNHFKPEELGWMDDFDTRQAAYWSMMSGAFGHNYGNHNVWQMYDVSREPINMARTNWKVALNHPGAYQMGLMRTLFESRNWQSLVYTPDAIAEQFEEGPAFVMASVSSNNDFMMAYFPYGKRAIVNTTKLKAKTIRVSLFNPRDGSLVLLEETLNTGYRICTFPSIGRGSDWVLIFDKVD